MDTAGAGTQDASSTFIGGSPKINVEIGGVVMECITDSGSPVSTVDGKWFRTHISDAVTASGEGSLFPERAVNGLAVPYSG